MELNEFLVWLFSGGGAIIATSWLVERWPWFQTLAASTKEFLLFASAAIISCGAYAVVSFVPQATLDQIAPWFLIVSGVLSSVFVGKLFHSADKRD